ncbi:MAG TPA: ABC transporter permease [Blastocatellia bacterium]|nr:ABC transporter permease [Blastocatellia bacterium]
MEAIAQDLRYSVRTLLRKPAFTVIAILAIALGIGANSAIFSVVNAVLLDPLPYRNADRIMVGGLSLPDYRDIRQANKSFEDMAVYASNLYNVTSDGETEQVRGAQVSPSFFTMLGEPALGRVFTDEDAMSPLVVLSYGYWKTRYGADPDVLGRGLVLGDESYTIVGVMPPEFQFPRADFKFWVSIAPAMARFAAQAENRSLRIFRAIALLKEGVTPEQANAELGAISAQLAEQYPDTNRDVSISFTPLYEWIVEDTQLALYILLGAVGLVLLIACANVANLLLARMTVREREIAIRTAIGASRWRIIRQLLTESVLLSVIGGAAGLLLAGWCVDLIPRLGVSDIPRSDFININVPVLLFTIAVSLLTGMLFGLAPAIQASKSSLVEALKEGGRGSHASAAGKRLRSALVTAEVALSVVVLIGAGLLVKSFATLLTSDPGYIAENLITMNVQVAKYKEPERRAQVVSRVLEEIRRLPGVLVAGGGTGLPPETAQRMTRLEIEGRPDLEGDSQYAYFLAASPDYFRALGTDMIEGREFTERDTATAPEVAIVSETLARRIFGDEGAVGKRLKLINPEQQPVWRTIVGVVRDVRYRGLDDNMQSAIYTPFSQTPFLWTYVFVRATGEQAAIVAGLKDAVRSADPGVVAAAIRPMEHMVWDSVSRPRFNMLLLSSFAALALVLAAVGIYGVISYTVAQRTHEVGIRMAVGARPLDVMKLVAGQAMKPVFAGLILGLGVAFVGSSVLESLLFEVSSTDPSTYLATAALLTAVAVAACYLPARRAAKVDPVIALRHE